MKIIIPYAEAKGLVKTLNRVECLLECFTNDGKVKNVIAEELSNKINKAIAQNTTIDISADKCVTVKIDFLGNITMEIPSILIAECYDLYVDVIGLTIPLIKNLIATIKVVESRHNLFVKFVTNYCNEQEETTTQTKETPSEES